MTEPEGPRTARFREAAEDVAQEAFVAAYGKAAGRLHQAVTEAADRLETGLDDADYEEVRQAVGRGAPTLLLGTSTRSLERNLQKLRAIERAGSRSSSATGLGTRPAQGNVSEEKAPTPDPGTGSEASGLPRQGRQASASPQIPKSPSPSRFVPPSSSSEAQPDELNELMDELRMRDLYEVDLTDTHHAADMVIDIKDRIIHIYQIVKTRVFAEDRPLRENEIAAQELREVFTDYFREALRALETYAEMLRAYNTVRDFSQEPQSGNLEKMRQDLHALSRQRDECGELIDLFRRQLSGLLTILQASAGSQTSANPPRAAGA